jgi:hypothetical protein
MGHNEYSPVKKSGHSASIFGTTHMGATVIDALDTLLIMNMTAEAARARDWIANNLSFDVVRLSLCFVFWKLEDCLLNIFNGSRRPCLCLRFAFVSLAAC